MFGDSNGQIKLRAEQKFKFLCATDDKGVRTFPKVICPKVNVAARLEYELAL